MTRIHTLLIAATLAAAPAIRANEVESIEPDWTQPALQKQLAAGEIPLFYPKTNPATGGYLAAAVHMDATKAEVWKIVAHPDRGPEYLSGIRSATILEEAKGEQRVLTECQFTWLPIVWSYEYKTKQTELERIRFDYLRGNLRHFEGHWVLLEGSDFGQNGGAIVYYELYLDPGKLVPKTLVRYNLKKDVPDVLDRLRSHIDQLKGEAAKVAAVPGS